MDSWQMQKVMNRICPFCGEESARAYEDFTPSHDKIEVECGTWWLLNRVDPASTKFNQSKACKRIESLENENERLR